MSQTRLLVVPVLLGCVLAGAGGCGGGESQSSESTRPANLPMIVVVAEPDVTVRLSSTRPAQ